MRWFEHGAAEAMERPREILFFAFSNAFSHNIGINLCCGKCATPSVDAVVSPISIRSVAK